MVEKGRQKEADVLDIYVIGVGGVGGYVVERLPMAIGSLTLDLIEKDRPIDMYLEKAGNVSLPPLVRKLVLVDGDTFNPRNALRQGMGAGGKLVQRLRRLKDDIGAFSDAATRSEKVLLLLKRLTDSLPEGMSAATVSSDILSLLCDHRLLPSDVRDIKRSMLAASFLQRTRILGYNNYVSPDNIEEIMPAVELDGANASQEPDLFSGINGTVVFMAVDNFKTRYEIAKYIERFDNVLLLNGGNAKTNGHVTVYERKDGKELDPPIYEVYENIRPDIDKRPDELGCVQIAPAHDQLAVTNAFIADVMLSRFLMWARNGLDCVTVTDDGKSIKCRYNEILIDINSPIVTPLYHPTKKPKKESKK